MLVRQISVATLDDAPLKTLAEIAPNLVLVFAAPQFFTQPGFPGWLARAFPAARRVAVSSAGEIATQGVNENTVVVTAIHFEKVPFKVAATEIAAMADSAGAGRRLAQQLAAPDLKAVVLLSQGVAVPVFR